MHNEEFHNLYASQSIIRVIKIGGTCSTHGRGDKCIECLGWKV